MKQKGTNQNHVLEMNRSLVIKLLQGNDICSRAELASMTGLTQASITKIISAMIDKGIVNEIGLMEGGRGRRSIGLKLNSDRFQILGLKFERKSFSIGVFNISGKQFAYQKTDILDGQTPAEILTVMKSSIHEYISEYPVITAICMSQLVFPDKPYNRISVCGDADVQLVSFNID